MLVIERTPDIDEDTLMMQALDAGASDFQPGEDVFEVICEPADFSQVRKSLEEAGYSFVEAELTVFLQTPSMFPRIISKGQLDAGKL